MTYYETLRDTPLTIDQKRIIKYLKDQIAKNKIYFKSKHIAKDLNSTAKTIGVQIGLLSHKKTGLKIQKWGISRATTWKIELLI